MSLRIRRGTEAQRTGVVFDSGELIVTTDEFKLFVGDGITLGGRNIARNIAGSGLIYNPTTEKLDISINVTTDDVPEGVNAKYFTNDRAVDAVGAALVAGNSGNQNVIFTYNAVTNTINADVALDGGLLFVEDDPAPKLGGNLNLNSFEINGNGHVSITGDIDLVGDIGAVGNINSTGTISGVELTGNFTGTGVIENPVFFGTPFPPLVNNPEIALTGYGVTDGSSGGFIDVVGIRNSYAAMTNLQVGDLVGGFRIRGRIEGQNKPLAALAGIIAPTADLTDPNPETDVIIAIANGNGAFTEFKFAGGGDTFFPGAVQIGSYTTSTRPSGTNALPGMLILNTQTGKFQGYTNNIGDGNPGWVDLS